MALKMFNFLANIVSKHNLSPNLQEFKSRSKDDEEALLKLKSNLQNLLSLMEEEGEPLHSKKVQLVKDTIKGFDELCSLSNHNQTTLSVAEDQASNSNSEFSQVFREFAPKEEQIENKNILQM